jgi:hypothetical protein
MDEQKDLLGGYDELELIELGDADVYGGTTTVPCSLAISTFVTAEFCPTTKCTSKCGT